MFSETYTRNGRTREWHQRHRAEILFFERRKLRAIIAGAQRNDRDTRHRAEPLPEFKGAVLASGGPGVSSVRDYKLMLKAQHDKKRREAATAAKYAKPDPATAYNLK